MSVSLEDDSSGNSPREELESIHIVRILPCLLVHLAQPWALDFVMLMAELLSEYPIGFIQQFYPHPIRQAVRPLRLRNSCAGDVIHIERLLGVPEYLDIPLEPTLLDRIRPALEFPHTELLPISSEWLSLVDHGIRIAMKY